MLIFHIRFSTSCLSKPVFKEYQITDVVYLIERLKGCMYKDHLLEGILDPVQFVHYTRMTHKEAILFV